MSANLVDAQVFVLPDEIWKSRHYRARWTIQSLKRADLTDYFAGIDS
jgi:hypothetical protein